jgi:hypothetical protein
MLQACFANRAFAVLDGAHRKPYCKPFVAAPAVNSKMVNRSAPDLFPAMGLVKKSFIPREKWSAVP